MEANEWPVLRLAGLFCCAVGLLAGCRAGAESAAVLASPPPAVTAVQRQADQTRDDQLRPGHYATEGGWGQLSIDSRPVPRFMLDTESGGDGCRLAGALQGGRGRVTDDDGKATQCVIELMPGADGIEVGTTTAEACATLCGVNASYAGQYRPLPAACAPAALAATRADFKRRYDGKAYAQAAALLARPYRECIALLPLVQEGSLRNDYALALHHAGDNAGCMEALAKYRPDAMRSDDEIEQGMAPSVVGDYLTVIGAARTNLALCGAGAPAREASP